MPPGPALRWRHGRLAVTLPGRRPGPHLSWVRLVRQFPSPATPRPSGRRPRGGQEPEAGSPVSPPRQAQGVCMMPQGCELRCRPDRRPASGTASGRRPGWGCGCPPLGTPRRSVWGPGAWSRAPRCCPGALQALHLQKLLAGLQEGQGAEGSQSRSTSSKLSTPR